MRHIHLIDTSVATDNLGDEIIVEQVSRALLPLLADAYVTRSSGHDGLGPFGRRLVAQADVAVLMGTNALAAKFKLGGRFIWHVEWGDLVVLRHKVVLMGVGANRDFTHVDWRQKRLLAHLLSPDHVHAVRDDGAARIVAAAGRRAMNTSCPTLWGLGDAVIPTGMANRAVFTLTAHKADASDAAMVDTLLAMYPQVWFWPQQPRDLTYLRKLPGHDRVTILPPNLAAYDALLTAAPIDVVGTRLHGCIRGLHHGRRSLAVVVDNRARAIGAEVGLPVITRADMSQLAARLAAPYETRLSLPRDTIAGFLSQFRKVALS